jgi:cell division protein FtsW (lipid II flippase)
MSNVKDNTGSDFSSYNKMQKDIDNVQKRIIEVDGIMQKNKLKTIYDVDTSLAKEEETALLTKQRYYVYMIWFIILAIILYITISNIFNPESSFSILLISLVLLICIFLFFMYSNWNTEWYDLKIKLKNLDFGLPDIPAIDFNPLVSIKYTS